MTLTGEQFEIGAGEFRATITEVGAGLRGFTHRGVDVTVPFDADELPPWCCGAVLVPWPNRIRDGRYTFLGESQQLALTEPDKHNAIHGLGRWARWTASVRQGDRVTLALDVVPQKGFPFEVRVEVTYALHAELGLSVSASAHNHGTRPAPFGAGFHPYLSTRGAALDATTVRIPAAERLLMDEAQVPVGVQSVEGTPHDLRAGKQLGTFRMDDGFTGLAGRGRPRVGRGARGGGRREVVVRRDVPLSAGVHEGRSRRCRPGRRDRADDLRARRVQLDPRADRARSRWHLGRVLGHPAARVTCRRIE